eukprot:1192329-Prorocentrum_minimum.AAC.5
MHRQSEETRPAVLGAGGLGEVPPPQGGSDRGLSGCHTDRVLPKVGLSYRWSGAGRSAPASVTNSGQDPDAEGSEQRTGSAIGSAGARCFRADTQHSRAWKDDHYSTGHSPP